MDQIFYVNSASFVDANIESFLYASTGSSVDFSQATQVSGSFVGNLQGNASTATSSSYAITASTVISASYAGRALTASYVNNGQRIKSGIVSGSAFSFGHASTYDVTFSIPFPNTLYSITITGGDSRAWFVQSQTSSGFTINSNSNRRPTGLVYWQAIAVGEFNS